MIVHATVMDVIATDTVMYCCYLLPTLIVRFLPRSLIGHPYESFRLRPKTVLNPTGFPPVDNLTTPA